MKLPDFVYMVDVLKGVVSTMETVTQFLSAGIWLLTTMIILHRGWTISTDAKYKDGETLQQQQHNKESIGQLQTELQI